MERKPRSGWEFSCFLGLLFSSAVTAHELETSIGLELAYDDNIFRDRNFEVPDLIRRPSLNINYLYEFTNFTAELDYEIDREDYRDDSFEDRTDVIGEASVNWTMISNRVNWLFYSNRNRISIDNQEAETPENEDDRTVYRTGPNIYIIASPRHTWDLNAFYVESNSDEFSDAELVQASTNYLFSFSETLRIGVFAQLSEVKLDQSILDYDNDRAGIRLIRSGDSIAFQFDYGRNRVKRSFGDEIKEPFYSASFAWTGTNKVFALRMNQELTDSNLGLSLNGNIGNGLDNGDGNLGDRDIVERRRSELSYSQQFSRLSLTVSGSIDEQDFQVLLQDEETVSYILRLDYDFNQRVGLTYEYRREENEFSDGLTGVDEFLSERHRIGINYRINSNWNLALSVTEDKREFDVEREEDYDATRTLLTIRYRF